MDSIVLECSHSEADFVIAELAGLNVLGVTEDDLPEGRRRLQVFLSDGAAIEGLLGVLAAYNPESRAVPDLDWEPMMRARWEPQMVGERLYLAPSWSEDGTPGGRLRLEMPSGRAAGTGLHAATQIALKGIEKLIWPGAAFLDIGTGSGILAAAAHLLGAGRIIACDIDEEATCAALDYLRSRNVPALLFAGSCRSLRGSVVDVVAANISARVIAGLAGSIAACLKPGGHAIFTGFTQDQASRLETTLTGARLQVEDMFVQQDTLGDEWAGLIVVREYE